MNDAWRIAYLKKYRYALLYPQALLHIALIREHGN